MADWTWTVPATVVRVIDGDTIIVTLDLGWRVYRNDERIRPWESPHRRSGVPSARPG